MSPDPTIGATLRLGSSEHYIRPGGLIGRCRQAAIRIDEPSIAEAHALVVVRGLGLSVLALRGALWERDQQRLQLELRVGATFELAPNIGFVVVAIDAPTEALGIAEGDDAPRVLLGTTSLVTRPRTRLVQGVHERADAVMWSDGATWHLRSGSLDARPVAAGDSFTVGSSRFDLVRISALDATGSHSGLGDKPLHLTIGYDRVTVGQGNGRAEISGLGATLLRELKRFDGPVTWEVVAREVWEDDAARPLRRARFDMVLARIRKQLEGAGISRELIYASGTGHVELVLRDGDVVVER